MTLRSALALAALLAASTVAHATPQRIDATDMWFDAFESGWGLSLVHQGNIVFGALFVYGPDGQPTWYVAPDLTGGNDGPLHDGTYAFSGALYSSTGSWFGAPTFDAGSSVRQQVGTLTVDLTHSPGTLDYTVDGVHVTKPITRYTFRRTNLTGLHRAYEYQPASPEMHHSLERFAITDDGSTVTIDSSDDSEPACRYVGNPTQDEE